MSDEEVYCVCYPTDVRPAFRRIDRIVHFISYFLNSSLEDRLFVCLISGWEDFYHIHILFLFFLLKLECVWSGGHLYSCAPPTQVDGDVDIIKAIWYFIKEMCEYKSISLSCYQEYSSNLNSFSLKDSLVCGVFKGPGTCVLCVCCLMSKWSHGTHLHHLFSCIKYHEEYGSYWEKN